MSVSGRCTATSMPRKTSFPQGRHATSTLFVTPIYRSAWQEIQTSKASLDEGTMRRGNYCPATLHARQHSLTK